MFEQRRTQLVVLIGLALLVLSGCEPAEPSPTTVTVRDSAGIRIGLNPDTELPEWTVDPSPRVTIGSQAGDEGQDLLTAWASLRMPDGRIVVSNAGSNELRFYGPRGRHIRSAGGRGEGPGEFELIALIHRYRGDSLLVADAVRPRLTVFDGEGRLGRTIPIGTREGRNPRFRGLLADTMGAFRLTVFGSRGSNGAVRDTFEVALRALDDDWSKPIGRFPAGERFNQSRPNGSIAGWQLPFARSFLSATSDTVFWVGVSDRYEILGYALDGTLRIVVRLARAPTDVDAAARERFFRNHLEGAEDENQRQLRAGVHGIMEFPPTMPAFSSLAADTGGLLWVEEYRPPWDSSAPLWRVFDARGLAVAQVRMPTGLDVHEIGEDYVLGRSIDELGVEYIQLHELRRHTGR